MLSDQPKSKGRESEKQIAKRKADQLVKDNLAKIDQIKTKSIDLDNANLAKGIAHKEETQAAIETLKAQHKSELDGLPRGSKALVKNRQKSELKAYRDQRKADLLTLKQAKKAQLIKLKDDIKKIRAENSSILSDGKTTGFYTDKNGKRRPITAAKGK
jgi:hypothetical protein